MSMDCSSQPDGPCAVPFEIDCAAVKALLDAGEQVEIVDVRTLAEHAVVQLEEATLLPMQEFAQRVGELTSGQQDRIIIFCHHGGRSEQVAAWLRKQGYSQAQNMVGGIDAWSLQVDPTKQRY